MDCHGLVPIALTTFTDSDKHLRTVSYSQPQSRSLCGIQDMHATFARWFVPRIGYQVACIGKSGFGRLQVARTQPGKHTLLKFAPGPVVEAPAIAINNV